jgi:D-alanine-D-alanine ligase
MKKKIAVIFGGKSCEHDISILTALQAMKNLDKSRYEVFPVYLRGGFFCGKLDRLSAFTPFDETEHKRAFIFDGAFYQSGKKLAKLFAPDAALLCTHGGDGENGSLQGLLDVEGIPYTSSGVLGSAVCMNKIISKEIFGSMLLNTLKYTVVKRDEFKSGADAAIEKIESLFDYPVIVKPASLGSSIGIQIAKNADELKSAIEIASHFDGEIIAERALTDFLEINCAAIFYDGELIVGETEQPVSWNAFLTYEDKYLVGGKLSGARRKIPAPVSDETNREVKETVKRIYSELGLRGVVRIDFLFDNISEKLFVNEVNTIPGSLSYYLFEPRGITYPALLDMLIAQAENDAQKSRQSAFEFASPVLSAVSGLKK